MKTITAQSPINAIAAFIQEHIEQNWKAILTNHSLKLLKAYEEVSEAAYGVYLQLLLQPVNVELRSLGFKMKPKLPGDLNISREWGEEDHRERWMWTTMRYADGSDCGTIVMTIFHDHTKFRIPQMPLIRALTSTKKQVIIEELCSISPQFSNAKDAKTEYADYLESLTVTSPDS